MPSVTASRTTDDAAGPPGPVSPASGRRRVAWWDLGTAVLLGLAVALWLGGQGAAGIGWDETVHSRYGELAWSYYRSGGEDRRATEFLDLYLYGALFEGGAAALYETTGWPKFAVRHGLAGLCALAGVLAAGGLARRLGGPRAGCLAALALATWPVWVGHGWINHKDTPFAAGMALSVWALARALAAERPRWRDFLLFGLAAGLTLGVRVGGFLLFAFLAAGLGWQAVFRQGAFHETPWWRAAGRVLPRAGAAVVLAWALMVACWPWTHEAPLTRPWEGFRAVNAFHASYPVLFAGQTIPSDQLPRTYLPHYLLITTPLATLALAAVGWGRVAARRPWRGGPGTGSSAGWFLVALWLLFPVAYVVATRPNIYDGLRHFLFVLPAVAILTGVGADGLVGLAGRRLPGRPPRPDDARWEAAATAVMVVLLLATAPALVRIHPYQMTWFNGLAGGLRQASTRYETDYWTLSYREAAEWINARARERGESGYRVVLAANSYNRACAEWFLDRSFQSYALWQDSAIPRDFDFLVATTRYGADRAFPGLPVAHRIGRDGATFAVVFLGPRQIGR